MAVRENNGGGVFGDRRAAFQQNGKSGRRSGNLVFEEGALAASGFLTADFGGKANTVEFTDRVLPQIEGQ